MTLGEKIRYGRKSCGLSQEQLAERLCVSRSAIAKWETDKGVPDVENLKLLSRLFGVSVDSLLDDGDAEPTVVREMCNLAAYGRGCGRVRKDRMMRKRFPGAKICALLGRPDLTGEQSMVDSTLGFLMPVPFGSPEYIKNVRDLDRDFYLVEQNDTQLFVTVTEEYLDIRPLPQRLTEKTFHLGNWLFVRCECMPEE